MTDFTPERALPPLPEAADHAYVEGPAMQGGEYRILSRSYEPGCAMFSPEQMKAYALAALSSQPAPSPDVQEMEARKDAAYLERNQVVAALARAYPSGIKRTAIEGWSEDWHGCVYIDLPTGQASWHYHDSQAYLFAHLSPYNGEWDGHSTPEKYERLAALASPQPVADTEAKQPEADMFWDANDPERFAHSQHDLILEYDDDYGLEVGSEITIEQGLRLPKIKVRITAVPDADGNGDIEWEEVGTPTKDAQ